MDDFKSKQSTVLAGKPGLVNTIRRSREYSDQKSGNLQWNLTKFGNLEKRDKSVEFFGSIRHPSTVKLIIEVAINTEKRDQEKSSIYADANVEEGWLVLPSRKQIKIHRSSNGREYEQVTIVSQGSADCVAPTGLSVDVGRLSEDD